MRERFNFGCLIMRYNFDFCRFRCLCWICAAIHRQPHSDCGALAGGTVNGNAAIVKADESAHDRQAEAGAFVAAIMLTADLKERIAQLGKVMC